MYIDGVTGFQISCDQNKEKRCVSEMYNLLNQVFKSAIYIYIYIYLSIGS